MIKYFQAVLTAGLFSFVSCAVDAPKDKGLIPPYALPDTAGRAFIPGDQSKVPDKPAAPPPDTGARKTKTDSITSPGRPQVRTGRHSLTLHWISWDRPGKADITPSEDGWYDITGRQDGENGDYLSIEGGLRPEGPLKLQFRGRIEYRVGHLNGGKPCVKEGSQTFLSTRGRRYWRLQDMRSCDGLSTDYIDIYF